MIRQQGYSLDNREHNPDIVCIAAPIFGIDGNLAGTIGISAPDYRFSPEKACSFAEEVKRSAAAITEKLQAEEDIWRTLLIKIRNTEVRLS